MNKTYAIDYLFNKALTDKNAALMSLSLLIEKPVGIGDHSTGDFTANLDEALSALADAEDRLEMLNKHYNKSE
jgi:hypothetical protein